MSNTGSGDFVVGRHFYALTRKCRRTCNFLMPFLQSLQIAGCFSYKIPNIFILFIYSFPLYCGDLGIGQE